MLVPKCYETFFKKNLGNVEKLHFLCQGGGKMRKILKSSYWVV